MVTLLDTVVYLCVCACCCDVLMFVVTKCLSVCLSVLSVCLSVCLSDCPSVGTVLCMCDVVQDGKTALELAKEEGHDDVVKVLEGTCRPACLGCRGVWRTAGGVYLVDVCCGGL